MGEDQVEYWLEQARVMVEGSDCPEREKRRRIMESLRGPALEIIRSLRFSNPEASSDEYISAIDKAFWISGDRRRFVLCISSYSAEIWRNVI